MAAITSQAPAPRALHPSRCVDVFGRRVFAVISLIATARDTLTVSFSIFTKEPNHEARQRQWRWRGHAREPRRCRKLGHKNSRRVSTSPQCTAFRLNEKCDRTLSAVRKMHKLSNYSEGAGRLFDGPMCLDFITQGHTRSCVRIASPHGSPLRFRSPTAIAHCDGNRPCVGDTDAVLPIQIQYCSRTYLSVHQVVSKSRRSVQRTDSQHE